MLTYPFLVVIIDINVIGACSSLIRNWVKGPSCPSNRIVDDVLIDHCNFKLWEGKTEDDAKPVDLPKYIKTSPGT